MIIDLTPGVWMIFPGLVLFMAAMAGLIGLCDWLTTRNKKVDYDK